MKAFTTVLGLFVCLVAQAQFANVTNKPIDAGSSPAPDRTMLVYAGITDDTSSKTGSSQTYIQPAWESTYSAFVQTGLFATTEGVVPLWMRSRRFGSIPADGISGSLVAGAYKTYSPQPERYRIDWGAGVEARLNAASNSKLILIEAYAKARTGIFQLKAGRSREITGLVDSTLSSGAFAISGNALGIPKVEIGFADYWDIPGTKGVLAIKWNLAHGWAGSYDIHGQDIYNTITDAADCRFHQKSIYGRLGKPDWKVKLYGGINHQVIWGNGEEIYPEWGLSKFKTFEYVFIAKKYEINSNHITKVGNHLGSVDQAFEWNMGSVLLTGYHQFFYDNQALSNFDNIKDGLLGFSLQNRNNRNTGWQWQKFLIEIFNTKNQGYEANANEGDDYYNHVPIHNGWSYKGENLGSPLISAKKYIRDGFPEAGDLYFTNNRVMAFHGGADFGVYEWQCRALLSYSKNYGTFPTSFPETKQFSASLETHKALRNGFELDLQLAIDRGDLLPNAVGGGITLTKRW